MTLFSHEPPPQLDGEPGTETPPQLDGEPGTETPPPAGW